MVPTRVTWSVFAGVYAFLSSVGLLSLLSPVSVTLATLLRLPAAFAAIILASPTLCLGAGAWFAVVERRQAYTYRSGIGYGVLTAVSTVLFWVLMIVRVWGMTAMRMRVGQVLILFVLAVAVGVALPVGLTAMYARRRIDQKQLVDNGQSSVSE